MRKRLLIGLLTVAMTVQSLSMPVMAASTDSVNAELSSETFSEVQPGDETDEQADEPEAEQTGAIPDEESGEITEEQPGEEQSDEAIGEPDEQPGETLEEQPGDETGESEEETPGEAADEPTDEDSEAGQPDDEIDGQTGEPEVDRTDDMPAELEVEYVDVSDGVYQAGAFDVLGEDADSDWSPNSIMSEMFASTKAEVEEYIYQQLLAKKANISMSGYSILRSDIAAIYSGVLNEHPELYYVTTKVGWSYNSNTNIVTSVTPTYIDGLNDSAFQTGLQDALAAVQSDMTDLEKAIALHDYIVINCEYDYDNYLAGTIPQISYSAYGVFANRTAVCQGYALAYKLLLNKVGIECYMVTSKAMNHAWNLIVLDGEYYQVDTTWDDPVRDYFGQVRHDNMFVSDETFRTRCEHYDWTITKGSSTVALIAEDTRYDDAFWVDVISPLVLSDHMCYYIKSSDGIIKRRLVEDSEEVILNANSIGKWSVPDKPGYSYTSKYSGLFMLGDRLYYNTPTKICSVLLNGEGVREETTVLSVDNTYVYGSAFCMGEVRYVLKYMPSSTDGTILTAELLHEFEVPVREIILDCQEAVLSIGESMILSAIVSPAAAKNREVTWTSDNVEVAVVNGGVVTAIGGGSCVITASAGGRSAQCKITVRPAKPVFSPLATVDKGGAVTISSERGADVYYTDNGKTPSLTDTKNTKKYTAPIVINQDTTLKAIAVDVSNPNIISDVAEQAFKVCTNNLIIDPESITMTEGDEATITVKELPTTKTLADVTWESSDTDVAIVSSDGIVMALQEGKADITASVPDHQGRIVTAVCEVTVELPVFQVTFIGFNNKVIKTVKLKKGEDAEAPSVNAPTGYEFVGWDANYTNVQQDIEIKALYNAIAYRIDYELNGGSNDEKNPGTYTIEDTIELLPAFGKEGYIFTGWYADENCAGNQITIIEQGNHGNITLYAGWKDERGLWLKAEDAQEDNVIPIQTYTGSVLKPAVEVYYGDTPLKAGTDYTLSYKNNKVVNLLQTEADLNKAPTVIIKGKGNYAGTLTKTFVITPQTLETETVQIDDLTAAYNKGKAIKPVPTVKWNGKKLTAKKDFAIEYPDEITSNTVAYKEPGEYKVVVKGCGNYTGTREVTFTIADTAAGEVLLSKVKISKIPNQSYIAGKAVTLTQDMPKLTYGKETLVLDQDYTLTYGECIDIGTYDAVITGKGMYKGVRRVSFKITGEPIKNIKVEKLPNLVYNGENQELDPEADENRLIIKDKEGIELTKDVDYTLRFDNNRNVGTAKMIITGQGRYTGSMTKTFKITANSLDVENADVGADFANGSTDQPYQKGGSTPKVKVIFQGTLLEEGVDYTLKYKNNTSITPKSGKPTVIITGKKNFKGSRELTFTIHAGDIASVAITAPDLEENTKAGKYMSTPVLAEVNGKKLKAGTDYEKQYVYRDENGTVLDKNDRPEVGSTLTVTVTGKGNYEGEIITSFRIIRKGMNISKAKVKINGTYYYTGSNITLSKSDLAVTLGTTTLQDSDFEIIGYSNNNNKGTAKVTIRGKGIYGGTKQISFRILSQNMKWWEKIF